VKSDLTAFWLFDSLIIGHYFREPRWHVRIDIGVGPDDWYGFLSPPYVDLSCEWSLMLHVRYRRIDLFRKPLQEVRLAGLYLRCLVHRSPWRLILRKFLGHFSHKRTIPFTSVTFLPLCFSPAYITRRITLRQVYWKFDRLQLLGLGLCFLISQERL